MGLSLKMYKPDQATRTRWLCAITIMSMSIYGAIRLYESFPSTWRNPIEFAGIGTMLGQEFVLSLAHMMALIVFLSSVVGTYILMNQSKVVDFFIDTESEMTKVSWSSKRDVTGASIVVIVTVIILSVWIAIVDMSVLEIKNLWAQFWGG